MSKRKKRADDDFLNEITDADQKLEKKHVNSQTLEHNALDKLKEKYEKDRQQRKTETISVRVPIDLYNKLDEKAVELRVSVGVLSRDLLKDCVENIS